MAGSQQSCRSTESGKGFGTAPRDALIALHSTRSALATSFGVHRALDAAGVVIGPLVAFLVLYEAPGSFDSVFVASFAAAIVGLAILVLFVDGKRTQAARVAVPLRDLVAICGHPSFRWIAVGGGIASIAVMSDAFLYLALASRAGHAAGRIPLFYVVTACVFLALAIPAGRMADRYGRARTFIGGHLLAVAVYAGTFLVTDTMTLVACLLLHGAYYAATDGVLAALASDVLPAEGRATGLAALATIISLGRLCSSLIIGLVWTSKGPEGAAVFAAIATLTALLFTAPAFLKSERTHGAPP